MVDIITSFFVIALSVALNLRRSLNLNLWSLNSEINLKKVKKNEKKKKIINFRRNGLNLENVLTSL